MGIQIVISKSVVPVHSANLEHPLPLRLNFRVSKSAVCFFYIPINSPESGEPLGLVRMLDFIHRVAKTGFARLDSLSWARRASEFGGARQIEVHSHARIQ